MSMPEPMDLTEFARIHHVSLSSVQKAIAHGRIGPALVGVVKGERKILDPDAAWAQWEANTRPRVDSRKGGQARDAEPATPTSLAQATLRERLARAESFELETERKRGTLVGVAEVEHRWAAAAVRLRTGMLGLPTRARQRIPNLTAKDMLILDGLVRELLEEFAGPGEEVAANGAAV